MRASEGTFLWSSGESVAFRNWAVYEPNNLNEGEDYVAIYGSNIGTGNNSGVVQPGTWYDTLNDAYPYEGSLSGNNFGPVYGVAEVIPEPSAFAAIAGLAVLGIVAYRRRGA